MRSVPGACVRSVRSLMTITGVPYKGHAHVRTLLRFHHSLTLSLFFLIRPWLSTTTIQILSTETGNCPTRRTPSSSAIMAASTDSSNEKATQASADNHLKPEQSNDEKKRKSWRKSKAEKADDASSTDGDKGSTPAQKEEDLQPASFASLFRYVTHS
jgi:hypothetical protein